MSVQGEIRKSIFNNYNVNTRVSDSVLPRVRSESNLYNQQGDPGITSLTFQSLNKLSPNTYSRLTFGYLEEMFAGLSGEILWKPADENWGLGVEINHVAQRDFDQSFGLRDYRTTTGHVSAYFDFQEGYSAQIDVGQYLAKDKGGTFTFAREFGNGWRVGGYFTLTDVPFEDFGEGSFDKGIFLTIPLDWSHGQPSRATSQINIVPISRDGGARLNVKNRLYGLVKDAHKPALVREAARFWK